MFSTVPTSGAALTVSAMLLTCRGCLAGGGGGDWGNSFLVSEGLSRGPRFLLSPAGSSRLAVQNIARPTAISLLPSFIAMQGFSEVRAKGSGVCSGRHGGVWCEQIRQRHAASSVTMLQWAGRAEAADEARGGLDFFPPCPHTCSEPPPLTPMAFILSLSPAIHMTRRIEQAGVPPLRTFAAAPPPSSPLPSLLP
jgi:hypothetical protein